MDIIKEVKTILSDAHNECAQLLEDIATYESDIRENRYTDQYINDKIRPRMDSLRHSVETVKSNAEKTALERISKYAADARRGDQLNPEQITEDARLFSLGVKLTARDLEDIAERNQGNATMLQLVCRYAKENGIETSLHYEGHAAELKTAAALDDLTRRYSAWMGKTSGATVLEKYFDMFR